jgi:biopolymer transport protein ExbD
VKELIAIVAIVSQAPTAVTLNVVVAANGAISVDGRAVRDENELADRARDAVRKSPDVRAVIAADKTVQYGKVIAVMDALKRGGVTKIAFAVAPPP